MVSVERPKAFAYSNPSNNTKIFALIANPTPAYLKKALNTILE